MVLGELIVICFTMFVMEIILTVRSIYLRNKERKRYIEDLKYYSSPEYMAKVRKYLPPEKK